jgi:protein OS-9
VFTGGTPCDLTDLERETEVRFTCARQSAGGGVGVESGDAEREKLNAADANVNAIERIDEASTCRYTMTFTTPSLCAHDAFRTKEQVVRDIVCRRFDAEGGEEEEARGGSGGSGGDGVEEDAEAVFSRRGADGEL